MEEDSMLQQSSERRLGSDLLGPPGVDFEPKKDEKESSSSSKSNRRKSQSPQSKKRKSPSSTSRSRHSPSPPSSSRRHRSPTPPSRRNRFRYSPDRRSRYDRRRSPERDRRRSPYRGSGRSRWSPKKKPSSPPSPPPTTASTGNGSIQSNMIMNAAPTAPGAMISNVPQPTGQYGVMQTPLPNQLYGTDAYAYAGGYGVPQAHSGFVQPDAYGMQAAGNYNPGYPPPNAWGHDAYAQHAWMQPQPTIPDPNQMQQHTQAMPQQSREPQQTSHQQDSVTHSVHLSSNDNKAGTIESNSAHDAAVAQEAENQREELKKQRSSYVKKNSLLKKELKMLRDQRKDLGSGAAPPSPTTKGFIDENDKLQSQIMKKIATIENVIEMLTGVIGEEHVECEDSIIDTRVDEATENAKLAKPSTSTSGTSTRNATTQQKSRQHRTTSTSSNSSGTSSVSTSTSSSSGSSSSSDNEDENKKKTPNNTATVNKPNNDDDDDDDSPERLKHKVMESMKSKQRMLTANAQRAYASTEKIKVEKISPEPVEQQRFNYAFYDPEMHWCQRCDVFPKTAKDYLNHLHSKEHMDKETAPETPWHGTVVEDKFPKYENAQTKRMPIRGITFFVPATAWYCKLCSIWMGDLHCASMHLKSCQHSNKYTTFLERNPNFEMNWLADRQRVFNKKSIEASATQVTPVPATGDRENKKSKKSDEKSNKKHKKNSEKKDKKKKKKRSKKRKKVQESSTESSSSDSSSSDESEKVSKKKKSTKLISPIKELDNPNPAASIRVTMRKTEIGRLDDEDLQPVETMETTNNDTNSNVTLNSNKQAPLDNWSSGNKSHAPIQLTIQSKVDDVIINQWNAVQPVISDNEKKLLEELKGKLKTTKPAEPPKDVKESSKSLKSDVKENRDSKIDRSASRREKEGSNERSRKRSRSRSGTRSLTRSRSRGRDWRRARSRSMRRRGDRSRGRRSRTRSRGRYSPANRMGRRRRSISRSRRRRTRSRSRNRRGRRNISRSRSRTRSGSRIGRGGSVSGAITSASRIEKPVLQHSEFRPRVPEKEKEKEKDKKSSKNVDKKDSKKSSKTSNNGPSASTTAKKLPFIGKMPVFKKQTTGQNENDTNDTNLISDAAMHNIAAPIYMTQPTLASGMHSLPPPRLPAPTAEQIKMAMMEDMYGNAPPFHPEAGVMHAAMDYDDLMPDPVQFVNLMAQAPPPPAEEEPNNSDVLPPGIDEMETEEFIVKPSSDADAENVSEGEGTGGSALPKDLEEALNIIFPGDRKSEDDDEANGNGEKIPAGETQIIVEEPVMQMEELYKEGIHMVSIEETSIMAIDEASRLSMNEPLVFNNVSNSAPATDTASNGSKDTKNEEQTSIKEVPHNQLTSKKTKTDIETSVVNLNNINIPGDDQNTPKEYTEKIVVARPVSPPTIPADIPVPPFMQQEEKNSAAIDFNLDDIPHPPAPLSESEKQRRQEELDDLAMLGIDADDMAAQCM